MIPARVGAALAGVAFGLDQASKYWAVSILDLGSHPPVRLLPVLDLLLARNKGISYSLFRADGLAGQAVLIGVALIALAMIAVWIWRTPHRLTAAGLGLVAGGAAGNAVDRIRTGAVTDFLYFHTPMSLGPLSNYVFNVADAAIVGGVALLLYESVIGERRVAESVTKG